MTEDHAPTHSHMLSFRLIFLFSCISLLFTATVWSVFFVGTALQPAILCCGCCLSRSMCSARVYTTIWSDCVVMLMRFIIELWNKQRRHNWIELHTNIRVHTTLSMLATITARSRYRQVYDCVVNILSAFVFGVAKKWGWICMASTDWMKHRFTLFFEPECHNHSFFF